MSSAQAATIDSLCMSRLTWMVLSFFMLISAVETEPQAQAPGLFALMRFWQVVNPRLWFRRGQHAR